MIIERQKIIAAIKKHSWLLLFLLLLVIYLYHPDKIFIVREGLHLAIILLFFHAAWKDYSSAVFHLLSTVFVLGANGEFQQTTFDVPLSFLLIIVLMVVPFLRKGTRRDIVLRMQYFILRGYHYPFVALIFLVLIGLIGSLTRKNEAAFILADLDSWLLYGFIVILFALPTNGLNVRIIIHRLLSITAPVLCLGLLFCYILLTTGLLSRTTLSFFLYQALNLGGHIEVLGDGFWRLYTGNMLILIISATYLFISFISRDTSSRKWFLLLFIVTVTTLFISYTRGYWIGLGVSLLCSIVRLPSRRRKQILLIASLSLSIIVVSLMIFKSDTYKFFGHRITSLIVLFDEDIQLNHQERLAIEVKLKQYEKLFSLTSRRPLAGYGFGATLPFNVSPRPLRIDKLYIFEASYGDLAYKTGFLGLGLWFSFILSILLLSYRIGQTSALLEKRIAITTFASLIGFLFTIATNPYINSYIFILWMTLFFSFLEISTFLSFHTLHTSHKDGPVSVPSHPLFSKQTKALIAEQKEYLLKIHRSYYEGFDDLLGIYQHRYSQIMKDLYRRVKQESGLHIQRIINERFAASHADDFSQDIVTNETIQALRKYGIVNRLTEELQFWSFMNRQKSLVNPMKKRLFELSLIALFGMWFFSVIGLNQGYESGLMGVYFKSKNLKNPILKRIDPVIDFDWGTSSPDESMPVDFFSLRWTGELLISRSGMYSFRTHSDDGVRLFIGQKLLIDDWVGHAPEKSVASMYLEKGWYDLTLEYFEEVQGALISLSWLPPPDAGNRLTEFTVIPEESLRIRKDCY